MKEKTGGSLEAGVGKAEITPALGIQLAGDIGRERPARTILEPLYARALVLEGSGTRVCLLSLDLLAISNEWAREVRQRIATVSGIPFENVVLHVTQNHASPSLGNCFIRDCFPLMPPAYPWLRGGDIRYDEPCAAGILAAAKQALAERRPVAAVRVGRRMDGRMAFNRRFIFRDGTADFHPPNCSPRILQAEGVADPEVGVISLVGDSGAPIATLLHHTAHTPGVDDYYAVSHGWPGEWCTLAEQELGGVALVLNGCCGNIHPHNHLDPHYVADHRRDGAFLMETTRTALAEAQAIRSLPLRMERALLPLPYRDLPAELVKSARAMVRKYPDPKFKDAAKTTVDWDWVYAVMILDLAEIRAASPTFPYEVSVIRIGETALVTLMGEPFVEGQFAIKLRSPAPHTRVLHFCHGYAGYIPTAEAFQRGGYETRTSNGSKFRTDALASIVEQAVRLLQRAYGSARPAGKGKGKKKGTKGSAA